MKLDLQSIEIETDIKLLNIVLNNLLTNALTYVNDKKIIGIYLKDGSLVIKNSADKISNEAIEKIFNPFYKVDESRNRKYGGTGLGLSIVKNLLEVLRFTYDFNYDTKEEAVKFIINFYKKD